MHYYAQKISTLTTAIFLRFIHCNKALNINILESWNIWLKCEGCFQQIVKLHIRCWLKLIRIYEGNKKVQTIFCNYKILQKDMKVNVNIIIISCSKVFLPMVVRYATHHLSLHNSRKTWCRRPPHQELKSQYYRYWIWKQQTFFCYLCPL